MLESGFVSSLAAPQIDESAFIAPGAQLVGDVRVAAGASVWFGCVLRSDLRNAQIEVGENSNIQDGSVMHIDFDMPCIVGKRVTVGHGAVLHATNVGDDCLVGMGAVLLSGSKVGNGSIVAAGAVVPEGMEIPEGVIVAGVPAKIRRECTNKDARRIDESWRVYTKLMALHRAGNE